MVIETQALTKVYGNKTACNTINLNVGSGQIYGFLGPNGAGKSTFIKMLTGLVFPTSGSGTVLGKPLGDARARERLGYLPEMFRYQEWMTGRDLLSFHASLFRLVNPSTRIDQALQRVGLAGQENFKVGSYSKGMQQRIGLACALLPNPQVLFLDEPTSALDPIGRKDVRDIIRSLKDEGTTVFLNSHLLSEVEAVCDHVTIIHKGVVALSGSMQALLNDTVTVIARVRGVTPELLSALDSFHPEQAQNDILKLHLHNEDEIPGIASKLVSGGAQLYELVTNRETLESVFLRCVGEEAVS